MDYTLILWPTDFSENSKAALPHVESLAAKYGARVLALHVVEQPEHMALHPGLIEARGAKEIYQKMAKDIQGKFNDYCQQNLDQCRSMENRILMGDPAEVILKTAEDEQASIIVMASHGFGGLKRFLYGSVAHKVVTGSQIPVLVVRPAGE